MFRCYQEVNLFPSHPERYNNLQQVCKYLQLEIASNHQNIARNKSQSVLSGVWYYQQDWTSSHREFSDHVQTAVCDFKGIR